MTPDFFESAPTLCKLTAAELVAGFAAGDFSPSDATEAVLTQASTIQGPLNAFTLIDHEGARASARASDLRWRAGAPLSESDGVPTTIKDLFAVAGWPLTRGSHLFPQTPMAEDCNLVARLRAAGVIFIGQTTTSEFAWKAVTDSPAFGVTRNPFDLSLTPGGSSGGAAVAAACGAGVYHLGSDGGGSLRIPAAFTGTVGLKPTGTRIAAPAPNPFGTVAHYGFITRAIACNRRALSLIDGPDLSDWQQVPMAFPPLNAQSLSLKGLRIALWLRPLVGALEPEIAKGFARVERKLRTAGVELSEMPELPSDLAETFRCHWLPALALRLAALPQSDQARLDSGLLAAAQEGAQITGSLLGEAAIKRAEFGRLLDRLLDPGRGVDAILSPSVAHLPFAAGRDLADGPYGIWTDWAGFSWPFNLSLHPALSLPMRSAKDALAGLQIICARGQDGRALDLGVALQAIGL